MKKVIISNIEINIREDDYISLTDLAKYKNSEEPRYVIQNWMKKTDTIQFLSLWEELNNPDFNRMQMDTVKKESGYNYFTMTPEKWIKLTNPIGIISRSGRYGGGTYAHKDIAFEFATWISSEFKLYLITEFQRLKQNDKTLEWNIKRELAKINYLVHADAVKDFIVPTVTETNVNRVYASEADVLNIALFGITASEWKNSNPSLKGNIRDYASIEQLVCLSNLENYNAYFIEQGLSQKERVIKLNKIAMKQMELFKSKRSKLLK